MDCETRENCEMISVMAVTVLQVMLYLQKSKSLNKVKILGDFIPAETPYCTAILISKYL